MSFNPVLKAIDLKPLPTVFAGVLFRSRLEARWAVFFENLGLRWEYEPEGFDLDGTNYLPDFYLPELPAWVEVKPGTPDDRGRRKCGLLAKKVNCDVMVVYGPPSLKENTVAFGRPEEIGCEWSPVCSWAEDRKFPGMFWLLCDDCACSIGGWGEDFSDKWPVPTARVSKAVSAALSARFGT